MQHLYLWFSLVVFLPFSLQAESVLTTQVGEEIRYLDPQKSTGIGSAHISINMFAGLYEYGHKDGNPQPMLTESYEKNADSSEYTFTLKPGFYWVQNKDGKVTKQREITAEDVVYSWRRMVSPQLASEYAYMLYVIKNGQEIVEGKIKDLNALGVKAIDRYKVKVTLAGPVPTFIKYLPHHSFTLVPKEPVEKHGQDWIRKANLWTSGPFAFSEWKLKDRITLVKNPHFPGVESVQLDKIHFRFIGTYSAESVRAFRAGAIDIDYQDPPAYELKSLKRSGHLLMSQQLGTYFFRLNLKQKPLDDKRVRRALALTVPRQKIVKFVMKAGQKPQYSFIPNAFDGYNPQNFSDTTAKEAERIAEAQKLLAAAGYPGGKGFPELELDYNTAETHKKVAVVVAKAWKSALGIRVKPMNQEWRVYLNNQHMGKYAIQRAGWIADMDDPMTFSEMFITGGGNNNTGFSNKKYDQLISQARIEQDEKKRFQFLEQAEAILMDELPLIPVFNYVSLSLKQKYVEGFYANKFDQHPLRFVKISKKKMSENRL